MVSSKVQVNLVSPGPWWFTHIYLLKLTISLLIETGIATALLLISKFPHVKESSTFLLLIGSFSSFMYK